MKKTLVIFLAVLLPSLAFAQGKGPKTGLRFGINTGYVFATTESGWFNNWNWDVNLGSQVFPWFYVGGGAGMDVYTGIDGETPLDLPVFGQMKFFVPLSGIVQPYLDVRGGYAFSLKKWEDAGIISASVGIEIAGHWNVSLGYDAHIYSSNGIAGTAHGMVARIGYRF